VTVAVDNNEPDSKTTGDTLTINEHEHTLHFACAENACDPQTQTIPAGKRDTEVVIKLHVKEAIIVLEADPAATIGIEEYPELGAVKVGKPVSVVVPGHRYIVLVDRQNPSHKKKVTLKYGQQLNVPFP